MKIESVLIELTEDEIKAEIDYRSDNSSWLETSARIANIHSQGALAETLDQLDEWWDDIDFQYEKKGCRHEVQRYANHAMYCVDCGKIFTTHPMAAYTVENT